MRGFITTSVLFILLVIGMFLNYFFVNEVHDHMHSLAKMISTDDIKKNESVIIELQNYWDKKNAFLCLSVSFREIDELSCSLDSLEAANKNYDKVQIAIYKEHLQNDIDAIMRLERISIKNIL